MTHRILVAALAALAVTPAAASATFTVNQGQRIADRYWAAHGATDPCHGMPATAVTISADLIADGHAGEATGLANTWDPATSTLNWYLASCTFTLAPNLSDYDTCAAIVHERGHLIYGAEHTGPMDPRNLRPLECSRVQIESLIRDELPQPRHWRITCTPASSHMHCRARRPGIVYERRYLAGAVPYTWLITTQS